MDEQELRDEKVEQDGQGDVTVIKTYDLKSRFLKPTSFSKGLSLVLFVVIPLISLFVGFNTGYNQGFHNAKDIQQSYQFTPTHKRAVESKVVATTTQSATQDSVDSTSTSTNLETD